MLQTMIYLFTTRSRHLMTLKKKSFENILGKGENAGNQHFLLFMQCFLPIPKRIFRFFKIHLFCRLQMLSIWTSLKICRLEKSYANVPRGMFLVVILFLTPFFQLFLTYRYTRIQVITMRKYKPCMFCSPYFLSSKTHRYV